MPFERTCLNVRGIKHKKKTVDMKWFSLKQREMRVVSYTKQSWICCFNFNSYDKVHDKDDKKNPQNCTYNYNILAHAIY